MARPLRVVVVPVRLGLGPGPAPRSDLGSDELADASTARALRQAGHEVIVVGPATPAERVAEAALQEDADAIVLAGPAGPSAPTPVVVDDVTAWLGQLGLDDVGVVVVSAGAPPTEVVAALDAAVTARPGLGADRDS